MKYNLVILLLFLLSLGGSMQAESFDYRFLHRVNSIDSRFVHHAGNVLSNTTPYLSIGVPVAMGVYSLIKGNESLFFDALYVGTSVCEAFLLTYGLKYAVQRPRPFKEHEDIVPRDKVSSYSFPSGHTSAAFSLATSLSIRYPKWYVIAPTMIWATGVGFARMYEGVHYPSDVLAGAVLGAGTAWLNVLLNRWIERGCRGRLFQRRYDR